MKVAAVACAACLVARSAVLAQTPEPTKPVEATQIEALTKKIDEQNTKIDALSQEILKMEQQLSHVRPGVMIGENTPSAPAAAAPISAPLHSAVPGNTHTVARGETLTSIAKMYKVTVDELQKANHIEDGRKLQAGQTVTIPIGGSPTPTPAG
ncbi:MAG TPA: LysM domain-containing protein [Candidatus Udaeobacter sp.]|jgi:LysM repeat protein|nr:LysM domain-containing protein [Candidatus Udaeobacter sp.]